MERTSLINRINDLYVNGTEDTAIVNTDSNTVKTASDTSYSRLYSINEDELQNIDTEEFSDEINEENENKESEINPEVKEIREESIQEFKSIVEANDSLNKFIDKIGYDEVFDLLDSDKDGKLGREDIEKISSSAETLSDLTPGEIKNYVNNNIDSIDKEDDSKIDENNMQDIVQKLKDYFLGNEAQTPVQQAPVQSTGGGGSTGGYSGGGGGGSVGSSSGGGSYNAAQQAVQEAASQAEQEVADLDAKIEELETVKIPESEENIQSLREAKDSDIEEQEQKQREAIEESDEIDQELKDEYKKADEDLQKTQESITEKENEKADTESQLSSTTSQISELDAQISAIDTNSGNEEKDAENQAIKADLEAQKADLEAKKAELEAEIETLDGEISDLKNTESEQEQAKDDILTKIEESLDENSPLKKIIKETKDEIENIKTQYEEDNTTAQETLDSQRQELEELKAQRGQKAGEAENLGDLAAAFENSDFANGVLADKAGYIEEVCTKYGVDPYLVSAIMASETGYGTSDAIRNKNNPGGYMDPATGCSTIKRFSSLDEGIEAVVRNLANGYINQGLNTVNSIGAKYCPVGAANDPNGLNVNWVGNVTTIYNELSGKNIDANTALC